MLSASHLPQSGSTSDSAARAPSRAAFLFARATDRQLATYRPRDPDADLPYGRPMADVVRTLEKVLAEADVLVRLRLKEIGLEVPHLVVAVTPDGEVVLRSNVSPDVLRSLGEDLKNIADELEAPPEPGDSTH